VEDSGETKLLQDTGQLMHENILTVHRGYHSILLKHGMDRATLDDWARHIDEGDYNLHLVNP